MYFSHIANLKCTPSDRQMYPRLGTSDLATSMLRKVFIFCGKIALVFRLPHFLFKFCLAYKPNDCKCITVL